MQSKESCVGVIDGCKLHQFNKEGSVTPEQSGGQRAIPVRTMLLERHDSIWSSLLLRSRRLVLETRTSLSPSLEKTH